MASYRPYYIECETRDKLSRAEELKVKILEETEVRKAGEELISALVAKRQIEVVRCPKRKKMDEKGEQ